MSVYILTKPIIEFDLEKAKYDNTKYNIKSGNLKPQKIYEAWKLENGIFICKYGS